MTKPHTPRRSNWEAYADAVGKDLDEYAADMHTPRRTIRVPESLWQKAKAKAEQRNETLSDVIRRALVRYARRN